MKLHLTLQKLTSSTFVHIIVNTLGAYMNIAFAVFYTIFLARVFSKEEFGVLSVLLVFSYVAANIFNFGMPATIYAYLPDLIENNKQKSLSFIKTNGLLLFTLAVISCAILLLFTPIIDTRILHLEATSYQYALALLGTILYIVQNFIRDVMNASGKFVQINIALNISNLIKLILLIILYVFHYLTISNTLIIMGIAGPLAVFAYILILKPNLAQLLYRTAHANEHIKIGFSIQYFVATQLYMLASRTDLFMIAFFLSAGDKGDYALSQRIVLAIVASADSITQVLSPQFALKHSKESLHKLLLKSFQYMLIPSLLLFAACITPNIFYNTLFTDKFISSIPITRLLALAYIPFNFASVLLLFFLYTIKKPSYVLVINTFLFVALTALNYYLIPRYELFGAPTASMVTFVLILALSGWLYVKEYNKLPNSINTQTKIGE